MIKVRVIAGSLRGRAIPFSTKKHDDADITPQKVKEALFSILGEDLTGKSFLDLYAGSGQIGIEAMSRGAGPVILNEYDGKRFHFIKSFLEGVPHSTEILLYNMHAFRVLRLLGKRKAAVDYIFVDLPYIKLKEKVNKYDEVIGHIGKSGTLKEGGLIVIQHYSKNLMSGKSGNFILTDTKTYGTTCLSFYREGEESTGNYLTSSPRPPSPSGEGGV
jgi:16S rRNA (guanine(966)-N(2))-methyltransferase RsmD